MNFNSKSRSLGVLNPLFFNFFSWYALGVWDRVRDKSLPRIALTTM